MRWQLDVLRSIVSALVSLSACAATHRNLVDAGVVHVVPNEAIVSVEVREAGEGMTVAGTIREPGGKGLASAGAVQVELISADGVLLAMQRECFSAVARHDRSGRHAYSPPQFRSSFGVLPRNGLTLQFTLTFDDPDCAGVHR